MAAAVRQTLVLPRSGAATTTNATFASSLLAGSTIIVIAANFTGTVGASGSTNGALTAAVRAGSANNFGAILYKENVSAGSETITVSGGDFISGIALEVTGLLTASSLDKTGTSTTTTVTASAANSQADELSVACFVSNGGGTNINITVPTSGYVTDDRQNDAEASTGYIGAHKIVSSAETSSASMTGSNSTSLWVGLLATFKAAAGGVALTGTTGTGSVQSVTPATSKAVSGNSSTGSVGTAVAATSKALTGNSGTGSVGTVKAGTSKALTANSSTGSAGSTAASVTVGLSGVSSTGSVGTVNPTSDANVVLTGNSSSGSAGSASANVSVGLAGVTGTGSVGSVTVNSGVSQAVTGVVGTGSVGQPGVNVTVALMGIGAAGFVGSVSTGGAATVTAGGYGKKKPQPRRQWIPEKVQIQQDSEIVQLLERQLRPELDDEDEEFMLLMS